MRRVVLLLAICVSAAVSAYAGPTEFEFLNWNGGNWENGYPYYIQPINDPLFRVDAVMCDDYAHGGMPGDIWDANITDLGSQNISLARFNNIPTSNALGPLTLYNEAGWILLQTPTEPTSEWKAMNYAVWHIFNPAAPLYGDSQTWLDAAEQEARNHFAGIDFNGVYIITPVNQHDPDPNGMQEFLYLGSDNQGPGGPIPSTPEPGTLLLSATGVLAVLKRKFWN